MSRINADSAGVEQVGYSGAGGRNTEVFVCERRRQTSARRTIQESDLNQIRLNDLLYRIFLLVNRRRNGPQTHWSAAELLNDRQQQFTIHFVETIRIDFHPV